MMPNLDICLYKVEFPGGEITVFAAYIIVTLIYAQCNVDGNEYLLSDTFVDHRKNNSALSLEDQKVVVRCKGGIRRSTTCWDVCCDWREKLLNLK